jgi:hypothetical protein
MKPKRNPAGTAALPRARLKARNLSQIAWVSTFQQAREAFAALIISAQGVWYTLLAALISILPAKIVLFLDPITIAVSKMSKFSNNLAGLEL